MLLWCNSISSSHTVMKHLFRNIIQLPMFVALLSLPVLASCHQESLEDKAERQARDYTRKYCPTPMDNDTRTDSIVFDRQKKVYYYYISFYGNLDDEVVVNENRDRFASMLTQSIKDSPSLRTFLEAGFRFEYVCHSGSEPKRELIRIKI